MSAEHEHEHEKPQPKVPGKGPLVSLTRKTAAHEGRKHFLAVVSKDEAERTWRAALEPAPLEGESVAIEAALGRVLAEDVKAPVDLPPFDRAVVDGFAVLASDTFSADESKPVRLRVAGKALAAGDSGEGGVVQAGTTLEVATGAPLPRGANAVVMVENVEREEGAVLISRAAVPGDGIQQAGSDVRSGEVVFRRGDRLGARETGVLAGLGLGSTACVRRPRVAVISTGDELRAPGEGPLALGQIFDANARIVCDIVRENGCEAVYLGISRDREDELTAILERARSHDAIVLSGGTSKGAGDRTYQLVDRLGKPGILVHGVAVKPGKPTVLAAWGRKPVVVLPGFPSSAAVTFSVFVKPVLRILAGLDAESASERREASLAVTFPAGQGRHEYVLCHLVKKPGGDLVAWPILKGSGSIAAFAQADGWLEVSGSRDRAERGERFPVTLLRAGERLADLVVCGSTCPLLDRLLSLVREKHGFRSNLIAVGSRAGLEAVSRGEADIAPVHLLENEEPARAAGVELVRGYGRSTGIVARNGLLASISPPGAGALEWLVRARERGLRLANRNAGSGTRSLIDSLLERAALGAKAVDPSAWRTSFPGYDATARSQEGALAQVASGKADFTCAIESRARDAGLVFLGACLERFDFAIPPDRRELSPVKAFLEVLAGEAFRKEIEGRPGFELAGSVLA
ncbi:molybdopterin biosynthesis protein [bacterium]|nr:molybdopterin biosynthesis protein [bacterium]